MIGIYKITSPSKRIYIGQSRNILKRFRDYKYYKGNGQSRLFMSFTKYGFNNHLFEILEECSLEDLNERERYWQEYYNVLSINGLNCLYVNTNYSPALISHETLINMQKAQQNRGPLSESHKKKISDSWKTRVVTEETKLKISNSTKGKKKSNLHKANIGKAKKGFKHSDESKLKMRKPKTHINYDILYKKNAKPVLQFNLDGSFVKEWLSASEVQRELGIKFQSVNACCNGKIKKSNGFIWKFKNI